MARKVLQAPTLRRLARSFDLSLEASNKSPRTRETYGDSVEAFARFLDEQGFPAQVAAIQRHHVEAFLADLFARGRSAATVSVRYRSLRQFFAWCVDDEEIATNPMVGMKPPIVPEAPVPIIDDDEMRRIVKVCGGQAFEDRRDLAIVLLLADTGIRRAECAGLTLDAIDLDSRTATVFGKGRRVRTVRFGAKCARALDRYLRVRDRHALAETEALWLGGRSRGFSDVAMRQMLERRGEQAGVPNLHAHRFRHSFVHAHLANGGLEGDLMALTGWRSRQMLQRYASSVAGERARANYTSPMDRL